MSTSLVSLRKVSKAYRRFTLEPLDLDLDAGRICGLVGPNGAGKSTLLRILMGLVRPDSGSVGIMGLSMPADQSAIKRATGFVSEDMRLHAARSLRWHADLVRSFHPDWDEAHARRLAERFELGFGERGGELSRGQSVKAMLMLALACRPRLLLLDEPTAGLDPLMRNELLGELGRITGSEGITVLFSSHLTGDIEALADDVVFLYRGRLLEAGPCERLLADGAADVIAPAGGNALDALFRRRVDQEVSRAV